jgi:hypothetical protein
MQGILGLASKNFLRPKKVHLKGRLPKIKFVSSTKSWIFTIIPKIKTNNLYMVLYDVLFNLIAWT